MSYQRSIPHKFNLNFKYKTNIWGHLGLEKKLTKVKWQKTYLKTKTSQRYLSKKPKKIYLKRIFKYKLEEKQKLRYFYGNLNLKKLKMFNNIAKKKTNNLSLNFIKLLESKLDVVLYRSNVIHNIFVCKYLIKNGYIVINNKTIKNNNYFLKSGDIIKFNLTKIKKQRLFNEFKRTVKKPLIGGKRGPLLKKDQMVRKLFPKNLEINYSTLSIKYLDNISNIEDLYYPFNLDIKASLNYFK